MSEQPQIAKAQLIEIDLSTGEKKSDGKTVAVQFNPESLKVTYSNQIVPPAGGADQNGAAAMQFVGAGTTRLALTVWFDVTALEDGENTKNDVRMLTGEVAHFITPKANDDSPPKYIPPGIRFLWGTFQFDGLVDSMEESLEYFSNDGRPLRASVALALSQQKIQFVRNENASGGRRPPPPANLGAGALDAVRGNTPLSRAPAGASLQSMADAAGAGDRWQEIAAANGITNPRRMAPGQLIDLSAPAARPPRV